jgi:hypothetical protein
MKRWKTIPALLALIALLPPCPHGAGYAYEVCMSDVACVEAHPACHTCTESVCSEKISIFPVNSISPVLLPKRVLSLVYTLHVTKQVVPPVLCSAGPLISLRTVQLLI